jgi:AcrR family transcriptional regulator
MPELPEHFRTAPVGNQQLAPEVLAEHQRRRIIDLVTEVFAKRGYQGTTVDDLLATGKVGVESFYSLFEGKEACFLAAFDSTLARARSRIAEATASVEGWDEKAVLGLREALSLVFDEPYAARIVLIEAQAAGNKAMLRYEAALDCATEWLRAGRQAHPGATAVPPAFEQTAIAGLAFYLQQCLLGSAPRGVEELFAEVAPLILEPLIGTPELRRLCGAAAFV